MTTQAPYFDGLYASHADPWHYESSWYEKRKRDLMLASLSRPFYRSIFEAGCSNGESSIQLAHRTARLLCCDISARAVSLCRKRLCQYSNSRVYHGALPQDWPQTSSELIVFSEIGYYLDEAALLACIHKMEVTLSPAGEIIACHWKWPFEGAVTPALTVHALLHERLGLNQFFIHEEADFILQGWTAQSGSVANHEGIQKEEE